MALKTNGSVHDLFFKFQATRRAVGERLQASVIFVLFFKILYFLCICVFFFYFFMCSVFFFNFLFFMFVFFNLLCFCVFFILCIFVFLWGFLCLFF